ncbi:ComF family protein [Neptunicella sp.]|uniref:ComF family protein n=1 Tax=Neptunicella sp. TaxID=2125986 RepID=UPI003F68C9BE
MSLESFHPFKALLANILKQQSCLICLQLSSSLICRCCRQDITTFDLANCQANLLNFPVIQQALPQLKCEQLLALGAYRWPLSNMLIGLKFSHRTLYAKALADLFCHYVLSESITLPQAVIPVPLHPRRFRQRLYNQSLEIARHITKQTGLYLQYELCRRVRATQPQTDLTGAQRRKNLHNAFVLNAVPAYQHVAIFDDIITTGTTVNELATTLKQANPDMRIDIWSICVALPD